MIPNMDKIDKAERMLPKERKQVVREKAPQMCPFSVIIDTREQAPWRFTAIEADDGAPLVVPLVTDLALATGDYSILGLQNKITIERKSVADFRGSITADRERFEREMERAANLDYAAVVIEGDLTEIMDPPAGSRFNPTTASRTIQSWSIRYGVHFFPMPGRRVAEVWAFRLLQMYWRHSRHEQESGATEQKEESRTLILNLD